MTDAVTDPDDLAPIDDGGTQRLRVTDPDLLAALNSNLHPDDADLLYAVRQHLRGAVDDVRAGADTVAQAGPSALSAAEPSRLQPFLAPGMRAPIFVQPGKQVDPSAPTAVDRIDGGFSAAAENPNSPSWLPPSLALTMQAPISVQPGKQVDPSAPTATDRINGGFSAAAENPDSPSWLQPSSPTMQAPISVQPGRQVDLSALRAAAPTAADRINSGFNAAAANPDSPSWLQPSSPTMQAPISVQPRKQVDPSALRAAPAAPAVAGQIDDGSNAARPSTGAALTSPGAVESPSGPPAAFIMHHTGGRGTPNGVLNTLKQNRKGVQYIMDRDGNIVEGGGHSHMLPGWGTKGAGLSNRNTVGMEVIAKDNNDVTPAQIAAGQAFIAKNFPNTPVFGHGEVNPRHKQATEGMAIVNAIRSNRAGAVATPARTTTTSEQPIDSSWSSLLQQYRPDLAAGQPNFDLPALDAKPALTEEGLRARGLKNQADLLPQPEARTDSSPQAAPSLPGAVPQPSAAVPAPSRLQPFLAPGMGAPIFVQPGKQVDPSAPTAVDRINGGFSAAAENPNSPSWLPPSLAPTMRAPISVQPGKQVDPSAPTAVDRINAGASAAAENPNSPSWLQPSLALPSALRAAPAAPTVANQTDDRRNANASKPAASARQDNTKFAYDFFVNHGLAPHLAAGIVGDLQGESFRWINPNLITPGDGRDGSDAIGAAQWNGMRAKNLKAYAAAKGVPWTDFTTQLEFFLSELKGPEQRQAYRQLMAAQNPRDAAKAMLTFEKPKDWNKRGAHTDRFDNAARVLAQYGPQPAPADPAAAP